MNTTPKGPWHGKYNTPRKCISEARLVARMNNHMHSVDERVHTAYSPSTGAIGFRWMGWENYVVANVHYPMYKRCGEVNDWVHVASSIPSK